MKGVAERKKELYRKAVNKGQKKHGGSTRKQVKRPRQQSEKRKRGIGLGWVSKRRRIL